MGEVKGIKRHGEATLLETFEVLLYMCVCVYLGEGCYLEVCRCAHLQT